METRREANEFTFKELNSDNLFFTSDLHFFHKNIIKYCNRPYKDIEEMNHAIIQNWNKVVPKDGTVFILGDVCFGGKEKWNAMLSGLNGMKFLVRGNHDMEYPPLDYITSVYDSLLIGVKDEEIGIQKIHLSHFPWITWPEQNRGTWQAFGHIHSVNNNSSWDDKLSPGQYDVGVDNNNYTPVSYQQLKEIITKQLLYGKRHN